MKKVKSLVKDMLTIYSEGNLGVYAGNATLFIITAVFPMLMLVISIVNMLPGYSPDDVTDFLFQFLPDLSSVKSLVNGMISNLKNQSSGLLASVAAVTTLWSASAGVTAVQAGLKQLSNTPKSAVRDKIRALLFTLLYVILIPAVLVFQVLHDSIIKVMENIAVQIGIEDFLEKGAAVMQVSNIVTIIAAIALILLTYARLSGDKHPFKEQLPGTIFFGVLFIVFTKLFGFFIPRFYHSSGVYGSLASLFLVLLWLRFVLMILFYGGALNTAISKQKQ